MGYTASEDVPTGESAVVNTLNITPDSNSCKASGTSVGTYNMGLAAGDFAYADSANVDVTFQVTDGVLSITQKNILEVDGYADPLEFVYSGSAQGPTFVFSNNGTSLTLGTDFTAVTSSESAPTATDVGTYSVTVNGIGSNYTGSKTFEYKISPAQLQIYIDGTTKSYTFDYTEKQIMPAGGYTATEKTTTGLFDANNLTYTGESATPIIAATDAGDYESEFAASSFAYNDTTGNTQAVILVRTQAQLTINQKDITDSDVSKSVSDLVYDSSLQTTECALQYLSTDLVLGTDFTVSGNSAKYAGTYTATIVGKGNFTGTYSKE